MEHVEPPISVIRQKVLSAFRSLGADEDGCSETILIKDRHVVGRRFLQSGLEAVWLAGELSISIFSHDGALIEVLALKATVLPLQEAA